MKISINYKIKKYTNYYFLRIINNIIIRKVIKLLYLYCIYFLLIKYKFKEKKQ